MPSPRLIIALVIIACLVLLLSAWVRWRVRGNARDEIANQWPEGNRSHSARMIDGARGLVDPAKSPARFVDLIDLPGVGVIPDPAFKARRADAGPVHGRRK